MIVIMKTITLDDGTVLTEEEYELECHIRYAEDL